MTTTNPAYATPDAAMEALTALMGDDAEYIDMPVLFGEAVSRGPRGWEIDLAHRVWDVLPRLIALERLILAEA